MKIFDKTFKKLHHPSDIYDGTPYAPLSILNSPKMTILKNRHPEDMYFGPQELITVKPEEKVAIPGKCEKDIYRGPR